MCISQNYGIRQKKCVSQYFFIELQICIGNHGTAICSTGELKSIKYIKIKRKSTLVEISSDSPILSRA